jgi:transposase
MDVRACGGAEIKKSIIARDPKYSPDLNPIEQVFAKSKHLLRKASARTREAICNAIGELLGSYTPDECANYLRNSGYGPT